MKPLLLRNVGFSDLFSLLIVFHNVLITISKTKINEKIYHSYKL